MGICTNLGHDRGRDFLIFDFIMLVMSRFQRPFFIYAKYKLLPVKYVWSRTCASETWAASGCWSGPEEALWFRLGCARFVAFHPAPLHRKKKKKTGIDLALSPSNFLLDYLSNYLSFVVPHRVSYSYRVVLCSTIFKDQVPNLILIVGVFGFIRYGSFFYFKMDFTKLNCFNLELYFHQINHLLLIFNHWSTIDSTGHHHSNELFQYRSNSFTAWAGLLLPGCYEQVHVFQMEWNSNMEWKPGKGKIQYTVTNEWSGSVHISLWGGLWKIFPVFHLLRPNLTGFRNNSLEAAMTDG